MPEITTEMVITLIVIAFGVFLFVKEFFSIDTTSILIMTLLIVSGVLTPQEGFAGFNNPATITVACMFVISSAIFRTGILDGFGRLLTKANKINHALTLIFIVLVAGTLSAFINDTAVVALLLPVVLGIARQEGISPSKLLMPLSFSALLGGACTLIGTSTNILVSGIAESKGLPGFGMFEFTGAALWMMGAGVLYMLTLGRLLLPDRGAQNGSDLVKVVTEYITEITLLKGNEAIGKRINQSKFIQDSRIRVVQIKRDDQIYQEEGSFVMQEGDELRIVVKPENLQKLRNVKTIRLNTEHKWKARELETKDQKLFEILIPSGSSLVGRSLSDFHAAGPDHKGAILAYRRREVIVRNIDNVMLRGGDLLLLLIDEKTLNNMALDGEVVIVSEHQHEAKINYLRAGLSVGITAGVILSVALGFTTMVISALVGCLLIILFGLIKPEQAYNAIEWKVIFMLAGVLSMGAALQKTGAATLLGELLRQGLGDFDPRVALSFVFFSTFMITNFMSNNATAALMAPIAISTANAMGLNERPFLVAVMFAASLSFMTPMSYQTNAMIYTPGNYTFNDYLRVGAPLNLLMWAIATIVIPLYFPF
ncbi:MAG: SLC13 family permease [Saprospiraceae bacterium]